MKANWVRLLFVGLLLASSAQAVLTTNSWFLFSGKWEDGTKWSAGVPSLDDAVNTITNDLSSITVTVDTGTVTQHVINSCMTISNLVVGRASVISHTLFLNNANSTPGNIGLTILNRFTINPTGSLLITNSDLRVTFPAGGLFNDGTVRLNTGNIVVTNLTVGQTGVGMLTVSNGTLVARTVRVAELAGSQGTLTIAGGTNSFRSLSAGITGLTGTVWVTGGQLTVSNEFTSLGGSGVGHMILSNGTWRGSVVSIQRGTLTVAGGDHLVTGLRLGGGGGSPDGRVWLLGGSLAVTNTWDFPGPTNTATILGLSGPGRITVSNGTFWAREMYVGTNTGTGGTLTIAGGTNRLTSILRVDAGGTVWITDGQLIVTNATTTIGASGVGQMTVSNGTWRAADVTVGDAAGSRGTLAIAGGSNTLASVLKVGNAAGATGTVWMSGGQLIVTNAQTFVGITGVGQMTVSNGTWRAGEVDVAYDPGAQGTLTVAGGTNIVSFGLEVGIQGGATGAVWVSGGQLIVTNAQTLVLRQSWMQG